MKNITKIFFILLTVFLVLTCITACGNGTPDGNDTNATVDTDPTNNSDPQNGGSGNPDQNDEERLPFKTMQLNADFFEVTWESVEGAVEYVVEINGKEYRTTETSYSLFTHIRPSETKAVRVTAVVDGVPAAQNKWGEVEYTAESVTEGLVYTKLSSGSYSVYCPSNAIPQNGELVLPDKYEGKNVTTFRSEKAAGGLLTNSAKSTSDYNGPAYTGISKVRLPAYLSSIADGALYKSSVSEIYVPDSVTLIGKSAFEGCANLCRITLSRSLKSISSFAFSDCTLLTGIAIPESITMMGMGAFARSGLTEISVPMGVTSIEAYTYYGCEALSKIEYATKNLSAIETEALHNTLWYNSQPDGMICYRIFLYDYKGEIPENTTLTFPSNVKQFISEGMFKDETNIVAVTLPEGLPSIPNDTFSGCTNLRQVTLSEGLTSIGNGAFYNCPIEQITLPESLETLGRNALLSSTATGPFEGCTELTSVTIPGSLTKMNDRCFYGCTKLESVVIEEGVTNIGQYAFAHCTALNEITLPESIKTCYLTAFAYTGVTSLTWLKDPSLDMYYTMKSGDGIAITYLIIRNGTTNLDHHFFYRCKDLKTFYFEGTEEEWEEIEMDKMEIYKYKNLSQAETEEIVTTLNAWREALTVYFYSETEPAEEGNFWHYVDGVPTKW